MSIMTVFQYTVRLSGRWLNMAKVQIIYLNKLRSMDYATLYQNYSNLQSATITLLLHVLKWTSVIILLTFKEQIMC